MTTNREEKRQEFLAERARYRGPNRIVLLVFALVAVIGVSWFTLATKQTVVVPNRWQGGTYNIGRSVDYKNKVISMTDIANQVQGGQIVITLASVMEKKIIYTDYSNPAPGKSRALTAMITPAGRLVVAIAMCEPCRSQRFHIEGLQLVCDTCGTRWWLNDLKGISGGCPQYPPEELPYEVAGDKILVQEDLVANWTPREVIQ